MESTHELIYSLTDGSKTESEQIERVERGELLLVGAMLPSKMQNEETPLLALQVERCYEAVRLE